MKKTLSSTIFWLILIVFSSLLVLWPLSKSGFYVSDDGEWMVIRLTAFFQSLREGQFPVRFLGRLNNGYGYPVANFLYPGFLYLGSFFHGLGFSFVDSLKIVFAGSVIGAGMFVFLWLRERFDSFPSLFGTLSFIFSPYLLFDLYRRGSIGEVLAFLPAAALFWAITSGRWWMIAPAVGFLIIAHNSLALVFLLVFIVWILLERRYSYLWQLALGAGMAAFFWLPAVFERRLVIFDKVTVSNPFDYWVAGERMNLIGAIQLLAVVAALFSRRRWPEMTRYLWLWAAAIFLATPASRAFWEGGLLPKLIQFPYRMLAVTSILGSFLAASFFQQVRKWQWLLVIFAAAAWIIQGLPLLSTIQFVERPETYYTTNEGTTTVADEYLPRWVSQKPLGRASSPVEFYGGGGLITAKKLTSQTFDLFIQASTDSIIQINTIYYPGWGMLVDGEQVKIDYANPAGVMRVMVPGGTHHLFASFRETPWRFMTDVVSAAAVLVWLVWLIEKRAVVRTKL